MTRAITAIAAALCFGSLPAIAVIGPGRLPAPRNMMPRSVIAPSVAQDRSAALAVGRTGHLIMLDSWITSNYMPDDSTTAIVWYDIETLMVVASFFAQSSAEVTASVDVFNDMGRSVASQSFTGGPYPVHVNSFGASIGVLPAGYYRVRIRVKQGQTIVGQQFWIQIQPVA